jgi:hypothetical protein
MAEAQAALSTGMAQLLTPVVEQCDTRIASVLTAQQALIAQIELFSKELSKAEQAQDGTARNAALGEYAAKLAASRKKLKKVEMLAMQTRDRVDNIERMHEQLLASETSFKDRIAGRTTEPRPEPAAENPTAAVKPTDAPEAVPEAAKSGSESAQEAAEDEAAAEEGETEAAAEESADEAEATAGKKKKKKK